MSFGSFDIGEMGLELSIASISTTSVSSSSYVRDAFAMLLTRRCFADLTAASQRPPKCGALGGMKLNWMPLALHVFVMASWALGEWMIVANSGSLFFAPTKLVALSQYNFWQCPRRPMNLLRAPMNASVVRSLTSSRCSAFVAKQQNTAM